MFKRRLTWSDYFLIAANLIPVYGVWFEGWAARETFLVYALETFIIGVFTVLKLAITTLCKKTDLWYNNNTATKVSGLFFILFFIVHYGFFALIQTSLFSAVANIGSPNSGLFHFFLHWYEYINKDILIMLGGFILCYLLTDLIPFVGNGDYKRVAMIRLMFQPYGRIFIQQFIVILGSLFLNFNLDKLFILVFAGIKIWLEVFLNLDNYLNKAVADLGVDADKSK